MAQSICKIFYFSGTHWDREWYKSFQNFRYELVKMMDELIEFMTINEEFKVFHLDGQTIVLEDYLEIDDSNKEALLKLIKDERVLIGPWYCMPDEFLLSGESLIRNLITGHKVCKNYGVEAWKFGYLCDIFGHIAQMPQILNGFGIRYALVGRGTNEHTTPAYFIWGSPDGSRCLTYKLPDNEGYGSFSIKVIGERKKGVEVDPSSEFFAREATQYIEHERGRSPVSVVAIMDAMDHEPVHPKTIDYIDRIKQLCPNAEVYHTNLINMAKMVEKDIDKLPFKMGELNETARDKGLFLHLISHTLSSYYPLKAYNDQCQTLLEKWVEPLFAIGKYMGLKIKRQYVDLAYKYLIKNHPHDSICGCSIDQVHKDMQYRFDQCKELCNVVLQDIIEQWKQRIIDDHNYNEKLLCVINSLPYTRKEAVTVEIEFETGYEATFQEPFGYEVRNCFKLFDSKGREIPYNICEIRKNQKKRLKSEQCKIIDIYKVCFETELPPMGIKIIHVRPQEKPVRYFESVQTDYNEAENEYIILKIRDNGTICIKDKKNNKTYEHLLEYTDEGEIGDGWNSVAPVMDTSVSSYGSLCRIERVENGPARTVFRVTRIMHLPEKMLEDFSGIRRSDKYSKVEIISQIKLCKGSKHVEIETIIDNCCRDHRMKLVIPTGVDTDEYFANQPFAFVTRKAGIKAETHDWKEKDSIEKQMGGIVGKRGADGTGLVFISAYGLHECAVPKDNAGSIYITLFRSFGKTFTTNGEEGCQIQGKLKYKYLLAPIDSNTSYAELVRLQECLQAGVKAFTTAAASTNIYEETPGFISMESQNIIMSIVKVPESPEEKCIVIRLYNMSDIESVGKVNFLSYIKAVQRVNLNEEYLGEEVFDEYSFTIKLDPWKIATYKVYLL